MRGEDPTMLASVDNSLVNPETQETSASVDATPEVSIDVAADLTKKLKPTGPSLSLLTKSSYSHQKSNFDQSRRDCSCPLGAQESQVKIPIVACPALWKDKKTIKQIDEVASSCQPSHYPRLHQFTDELKPERLITYLTWKHRRVYKLAIQCAMKQAVEKRKYYLWSSFPPWDLPYDPMIEHLMENHKLYERQFYFDTAVPKVTHLYLYTNDPTYGALMEASDRGHDTIPWSEIEPSFEDLAGLWKHTLNLWTSHDNQRSRDLLTKIESSASVDDTCLNGEEGDPPPMAPPGIPPPQTPIPAPRTPAPPPPPPVGDWGHTDLDRWLTKIHVNTGHTPGAQMAHCLKEAEYDKQL